MLNRFRADPLHPVTEKECIFILNAVYRAHLQIFCQSIPAGLVEIKNALFIALAADFECGIVAREIVAVDTYEFRKPQSATVKQENDERISDKFEFRTFALPVQFVENPLHACRGNECRDSPGGFQCVDAVHDLFVDSPRTVEVTEETPQGGELPDVLFPYGARSIRGRLPR